MTGRPSRDKDRAALNRAAWWAMYHRQARDARNTFIIQAVQDGGWSLREVAAATDVPLTTVFRIVKNGELVELPRPANRITVEK